MTKWRDSTAAPKSSSSPSMSPDDRCKSESPWHSWLSTPIEPPLTSTSIIRILPMALWILRYNSPKNNNEAKGTTGNLFLEKKTETKRMRIRREKRRRRKECFAIQRNQIHQCQECASQNRDAFRGSHDHIKQGIIHHVHILAKHVEKVRSWQAVADRDCKHR